MSETEIKKWYKSKTIWVNVITLVAFVAQMQIGFVIEPDEQLGILAVVNLVLRIMTTTGLEK